MFELNERMPRMRSSKYQATVPLKIFIIKLCKCLDNQPIKITTRFSGSDWRHWTALTAGRFRRCWEEKTTRSNRMNFRLIRGPTHFGKALNLIFPTISSQNRRGFDHATILSPSFHGVRKERLAQWPAFCVLNMTKNPEKLVWRVRHASWNPYPISDLKPWSPARDRSAWQAVTARTRWLV